MTGDVDRLNSHTDRSSYESGNPGCAQYAVCKREHRTQNAERRTPSAVRRTQNAGCGTQTLTS
eukprot:gene14673-biopygen16872